MNNRKTDFPYYLSPEIGEQKVYMDFAATTPKPQVVVKSLTEYYQHELGNPGRGSHTGAYHVAQRIEEARQSVMQFFSLNNRFSVQFTANATYAINTFSYLASHHQGSPIQRIITTEAEHHSNYLPWQRVATTLRIPLHLIHITEQGTINYDEIDSLLKEYPNDRILLAVTACSNVTGIVSDKNKLRQFTEDYPLLTLFIDFTQLAPHAKITFSEWGAHAGALSLHKMFGPEGVGILIYPTTMQQESAPLIVGGGMINSFTGSEPQWNTDASRFEAGTPHSAGIIASKAALDYMLSVGYEEIVRKENALTTYFLEKLTQRSSLYTLLGSHDTNESIPLFSLVSTIHSHDIADFLDKNGVAVRAGHHCASQLHRAFGVTNSTRFSLSFLNTTEDIDYVFEQLDQCAKKLK